ncbi:DUF1801 domain-containing protein [Fulvivirga sp. M361]|uniref:iron chaperone n=1 Tax=Fulvivirga sp. M361 TaxID=2594266 RepID=UPI00117AF53F|nr:DUF1801 domain-containing protein [Fulvivirga sp. M361]TRX59195.1 DUF1801 domain-containing protein [Fulvivirga sp. M361]
MTSPKTITDYIDLQEAHYYQGLEQLRSIIKSVVPDAEELISYQIPSFRLHYMLVGFGVKKDAISLYTMNPDLVKSIKKELKSLGIKNTGSTLHFSPNAPLPEEIIKKIVRTRVMENETKFKAKNS